MPSGDLALRSGDRLYVLGKSEDLRSLRLALGMPETEALPTLHEFIGSQSDEATNVYSYALPVAKDSELQGKTIKSSGLREQYDCMILGLQRNKLPILQPDINMVLQTDDLVWVLGTSRMIEKLLASNLSEV